MTTAAELGVDDVLRIVQDIYHLDVDLHKDEARFLCVVHNDSNPSASVNIDTGLWGCWSCGAKGDLAGLGSVVLNIPRTAVIDILRPGTPDAALASIRRRIDAAQAKTRPSKQKKIDRSNVHSPRDYANGPLTYMLDRGFTKKTLKAFGVRYASSVTLFREKDDPFTVQKVIAIPIRNDHRKIIAWGYRATDKSPYWLRNIRFIYTPNFDTSKMWFGLDVVSGEEHIAIAEGPIDAMWLWQAGIPALGMMGASAQSAEKFRILERFRSVTIVPDYDRAGSIMAKQVGSLLRGRVPCKVARYSQQAIRRSGKDEPDPQDLLPRELRKMVRRAVPYQQWQMKQKLAGANAAR